MWAGDYLLTSHFHSLINTKSTESTQIIYLILLDHVVKVKGMNLGFQLTGLKINFIKNKTPSQIKKRRCR